MKRLFEIPMLYSLSGRALLQSDADPLELPDNTCDKGGGTKNTCNSGGGTENTCASGSDDGEGA